ncbi:hypothetical protein PHYPO_G00220610 [Pangasianodon hypophthalmus]|uniref:Uncharacterized protein n=1 Tax=Pangasianodon hypophthalmus TaxID=310915 RepID=A0A5N5NW84_PANHP|nr:hypothetical protein PHYPO_G00220610 [Pangasianodon hypophthalmus]
MLCLSVLHGSAPWSTCEEVCAGKGAVTLLCPSTFVLRLLQNVTGSCVKELTPSLVEQDGSRKAGQVIRVGGGVDYFWRTTAESSKNEGSEDDLQAFQ